MGIRTHTIWVLMKMSMEDGCFASGGGPEVSWASRTSQSGRNARHEMGKPETNKNP